jgi:3-oxoacyl-[acyl-carrier-protein] synthase-3
MNGRFARVSAIASYLPETVLGNDELAALFEGWSADKIFEKTGIRERRIAAPAQTATDLGVEAANRLFARTGVARDSIDFIIFCTQAPDYLLPTSACLIQAKLGLRTSSGALDINLGCSGFVYGLSLAKGLIETGAASRVLLLTADTYSRFIHPLDKSVRTLFGDGAAATLIEAVDAPAPQIGPFVFGTDGRGAENLIVRTGGAREARTAESAREATDGSGNVRSADNLFMDGPAIMTFTLSTVPKAVHELARQAGITMNDIDLVVLHQANRYMLEALRKKLAVPPEKFPICIEHCGNTVSSTIPIALESVQRDAEAPARRVMLVGFGVGYSWAGTLINF